MFIGYVLVICLSSSRVPFNLYITIKLYFYVEEAIIHMGVEIWQFWRNNHFLFLLVVHLFFLYFLNYYPRCVFVKASTDLKTQRTPSKEKTREDSTELESAICLKDRKISFWDSDSIQELNQTAQRVRGYISSRTKLWERFERSGMVTKRDFIFIPTPSHEDDCDRLWGCR